MIDTLDCIAREELCHDKPPAVLLGEGWCPDEIMQMMLKLQEEGVLRLVTFDEIKDELDTVDWYQGLLELFKNNPRHNESYSRVVVDPRKAKIISNKPVAKHIKPWYHKSRW